MALIWNDLVKVSPGVYVVTCMCRAAVNTKGEGKGGRDSEPLRCALHLKKRRLLSTKLYTTLGRKCKNRWGIHKDNQTVLTFQPSVVIVLGLECSFYSYIYEVYITMSQYMSNVWIIY